MLDEASVDVLGAHGLVEPVGNDRYLFETGVVPVLLVADLASVLLQVLPRLGILARLLFDVDLAGLVLGGRHRLQTAVVTHSRRTVVACQSQLVLAVLQVLESGGGSLRNDFDVGQDRLARLFVDFVGVDSVSVLLILRRRLTLLLFEILAVFREQVVFWVQHENLVGCLADFGVGVHDIVRHRAVDGPQMVQLRVVLALSLVCKTLKRRLALFLGGDDLGVLEPGDAVVQLQGTVVPFDDLRLKLAAHLFVFFKIRDLS